MAKSYLGGHSLHDPVGSAEALNQLKKHKRRPTITMK
jgi:hypothetical protein